MDKSEYNKLMEEFYNRDVSNESRSDYKKKLYDLQIKIWGDIFNVSKYIKKTNRRGKTKKNKS